MLPGSRITRLTARAVLFQLASADAVTDARRAQIYRALGVRLGAGSTIKPRCYVNDEGSLDIGAGCHIEHGVYLEPSAGITLEDRAGLSPQSTILTSTHEIGPPEVRVGPHVYAPVVIGAGAWIGAGVIVLPGVHVGAGTIVAAGAVVTADCQPNSIYGGIPARKLRDITEPGVPPLVGRELGVRRVKA